MRIVAGGGPSGRLRTPPGRGGARFGGRRQRAPVPRSLGFHGRDGDAVQNRAVQHLRRLGQRVRTRRRLRSDRPQARERGGSGRRPHLGRDPRVVGEPELGECRPHGPERTGAGARDRGSARQGGSGALGGGLSGGQRRGVRSGRPHRGARGGGGLRARPGGGAAAADRLGQDQHRAPGVRGGDREPHQGRPGHARGCDSQTPSLP